MQVDLAALVVACFLGLAARGGHHDKKQRGNMSRQPHLTQKSQCPGTASPEVREDHRSAADRACSLNTETTAAPADSLILKTLTALAGMPHRAPGQAPGHSTSGGRCLPRPHGKAANHSAMIMAECPQGMTCQIRNATFTLVDRGSWP